MLNDAAEIPLTGGHRFLEAGALFSRCLSAKTLISHPVRSSYVFRDGVSCLSPSSVLAGDGKAGKSQGYSDAQGRGTALVMEQDGST